MLCLPRCTESSYTQPMFLFPGLLKQCWRASLVVVAVLSMLAWRPGPALAVEYPVPVSEGPPDVQFAAADPALAVQNLTQPVFRLVLPFRTQKDGGPWQTSNCGPAALGMVLDAFGMTGQATDDLRFRAHTYQGTVGMRTGTALQHVAHVAEDYGLSSVGLMAGGDTFHHWTVGEISDELRRGHPVMPLVRLYLVPGYEGMAPRWGHYILITGIAPGGFYFSDPLKTDPVAGISGLISPQQLERAIEGSHIPRQATAFAGPKPLAVWTPEQ
jgi:Peptidase_C39 like family